MRECGGCHHRFAEWNPGKDHVSAVYGDSYFFGGGAGYPDYLSEEKLLREHGIRYARRIGRYLVQLVVHSSTLEDFASPRTYDLIVMIQVAGHFANLRGAFRRAADLTSENGFWLIETWDSQSLTARAFGRHWHEYSPPSVLNYLNRRSLEALAGQFGFDPVASGRPVKRIMWRHARSLLDEKIPWRWFHYVSGLIPDQTVPPYPSGDLFLDAAAEASGTERAERAAMDKLCTSTKFEDTCPDS